MFCPFFQRWRTLPWWQKRIQHCWHHHLLDTLMHHRHHLRCHSWHHRRWLHHHRPDPTWLNISRLYQGQLVIPSRWVMVLLMELCPWVLCKAHQQTILQWHWKSCKPCRKGSALSKAWSLGLMRSPMAQARMIWRITPKKERLGKRRLQKRWSQVETPNVMIQRRWSQVKTTDLRIQTR